MYFGPWKMWRLRHRVGSAIGNLNIGFATAGNCRPMPRIGVRRSGWRKPYGRTYPWKYWRERSKSRSRVPMRILPRRLPSTGKVNTERNTGERSIGLPHGKPSERGSVDMILVLVSYSVITGTIFLSMHRSIRHMRDAYNWLESPAAASDTQGHWGTMSVTALPPRTDYGAAARRQPPAMLCDLVGAREPACLP